ncbi:helix-turn-helix domain-containing protein [uncultured Bifidobacterium sp.]|uniref:AlbA family DNA-binding domain-containing protein n=1 Tax=uncultured Bifidobacterium sp. TaxID=165187 RepID=UPI00262C8C46|nr:ATP-binding protein [uncultured Bifidobacterium sp.]
MADPAGKADKADKYKADKADNDKEESCEDASTYTRLREGQHFDRKSARLRPDGLARHIIAFANDGGGTVAVGIEDDGSITGFRRQGAYPVEDFERIPVELCDPRPTVGLRRLPCRNVDGDDDIILLVQVRPFAGGVVRMRSNGDVYLRESDSSVKLDDEGTAKLDRTTR